MMKTSVFLLLFTFSALVAAPHAHADAAEEGFNQLYTCMKSATPERCRTMVTAASVPYFDRFTGYGLARCLPEEAVFDSAKQEGAYTMIRARAPKPYGEGFAYGRFYFAEEEGELKFDAPETLRQAMGNNWENRLALIEQGYVLLRTQIDAPVHCNSIYLLAGQGGSTN